MKQQEVATPDVPKDGICSMCGEAHLSACPACDLAKKSETKSPADIAAAGLVIGAIASAAGKEVLADFFSQGCTHHKRIMTNVALNMAELGGWDPIELMTRLGAIATKPDGAALNNPPPPPRRA
jgi:hypothetical protein